MKHSLRFSGLTGFFLFLICLPVFGKELSLDQVLSTALSDTRGQKKIQADFDQQIAETDIYRSSALPQLNLGLTSQRSSLSLIGQQGAGDQKRAYGNEHSYQLSLDAPIYSFGRLTSVWQLSKLQKSLIDQSKTMQTDQFLNEVINLYLSALLSQARVKVSKLGVDHSNSTLEFMQTEFNHGSLGKADFLRAQSKSYLSKAQYDRHLAEARAASEELKISLNLPEGQTVTIDPDTVENAQFFSFKSPEQAKESSHPVRLANLQKEISEKTVSYRRASYLPTLSLIAGMGGSVKTHRIAGYPTESLQFQDLLSNSRMNYYGGISLRWNLFDGLKTSSELHQANAQAIKATLERENAIDQERINRKKAIDTLASSQKSLLATIDAKKAMEMAYHQSEQDFKRGTVSLTELLEVQKDYYDTLLKYYEALSAKINAIVAVKLSHGIPLWRKEA